MNKLLTVKNTLVNGGKAYKDLEKSTKMVQAFYKRENIVLHN